MAINELVIARDFTDAARLRSVITSRRSSQSQYQEQYSKSCKEHISKSMVQAKEKQAELQHKIRVNLMILVSELNDPDLVDLALSTIEDKDKAVQYWAVRTVTKETLINHLKAIAADSTIDRISGELLKVAENMSPEATMLMVNFAAITNSEATEELALKLADVRIAGYEKYQASPGPVDMKILKLLCNKMLAKPQEAPVFGNRFCQLYSYVMQRYIYHLKGALQENERDIHMLASILVEIEDKCIGRLTGLKQGVIKDAVEKSNANALVLEHGRLLGDQIRQGEIPSKHKINYGENEDGSTRTMPKVLPKKISK
ncbi:MAG: hypothetical protein JW837_02880 [Sedimentisphaerales bacterium]|nr:hypothetical protein [Sedimentisphaerales bacterium]